MTEQREHEQETNVEAEIAEVFGLPVEKTPEPSVGTEGGEGPSADLPGGDGPSPISAEPKAEEEGSASQAPQPEQKPAEQPASSEPAPVADPRDEELALLRSQMAGLVAQLEAAKKQPEVQPSGAEKPNAPAKPEITPIQVQLPQEMLNAIFDEDPAKAAQGMNTLVSTIATGLSYRFEQRIAALEAQVNQRFEEQAARGKETEQASEAARLREDYFKAFPAHNKPIFLGIIQDEAEKLAAETLNAPWDENFRNTLGARVNRVLQENGFGAAPQVKPVTPAPAIPASPRPAPQDQDDIADEIMSTFS